MNTSSRACVVGAAETAYTRTSDLAGTVLLAEAIRLALDDAGLSTRDVDGLAVTSFFNPDDSPYVAEHLGFELGWILKADYGGAAGVMSIIRAKHAIEAGYIDVAVCVGGDNRVPTLSHDVHRPFNDYSRRNYVDPYGYGGPNSLFAMIQQRHMRRYGTTLEQLGKISVTFRRHAASNPNALLRDPITIDDYLASRMISDPIRLLDCVMPCSGAAAIVIANEDVAHRLGKEPVSITNCAERTNYLAREQNPERITMGYAAIKDQLLPPGTHETLDFLQLYDDYPIAIVMTLEDLGFCEKGQGGPFIERTDIGVGGDLPINTGGGQLSCGQPILGGGYLHVVEAYRQLRGHGGDRQVEGAARGLVTGIGLLSYHNNLACVAGMVMTKEAS